MPVTLDAAPFSPIPWEPAAREALPSVPAHPSSEPGAFERLAQGLSAAVDRGDQLVNRASRGGYERMDAATLIALQAGIYRYSEAVDLCAKLVDRTASATRTVLEAGR